MNHSLFKPLRHLRFWIGLWVFAVLIVIVGCLLPAPSLPLPALPNGDKAEHFIAYFLLAASAVQLFRRGRALLAVGVALVLLGIVIEVAQGALTTTRSADVLDALADAVGVLAGLAVALTPLRDALLRLQPYS